MKRQAVLVASLAAGLVAAFLTRMYMAAREDDLRRAKAAFRAEYGEMEALCFVRDVGSGTTIDASDLTTCRTFRKGNEGSVLVRDNIPDIIGRRTVDGRLIAKGVPLRWSDIEGGDLRRDALSADVPPHFRAVSINVNGAASVSGMIRPGDSVDVIGTFDFPDDQGKIRRGDPVTCTILQKVLVLATGSDTAKTRARRFGVRESPYSTLTLAVTPREAEMLAFAEHVKGRLVATLRNRNDTETEEELPTVDFTKIRSEIEDLNRERNPRDRRRPRAAPPRE